MTNFDFARNFKGIAEVFLDRPDYYRPLLMYLEQVMVADSPLDKIEREVIAAHVSMLNGCDFCVGAHRETLRALGAEERLLETLTGGVEGIEGIAPRTRALLQFAEQITRHPHEISRSHIERLLADGLDERAIEEAANVAGLFNYINRIVDVVGVKGGEEYFRMVGNALARDGYARLLG